MIVSFSSLNRFEIPNLTLCNPGSVYSNGVLSNAVGILNNVSDMEIVFNFNETSELNFRVSLVRSEDETINEHIVSLYRAIQNRRLVFIDGIGYFAITNVVSSDIVGLQYKDVQAKSIDIEMQQKMIPYIPDGTYKFSSIDDSETKGLLDILVEALPLWTVKYIDSSVASKYRTFEGVDTSLNCLGFMLDNIQDAYECIFVFDSVYRTISVYDQNNYVQKTGIYLTKHDLINSINITENAEDLYTAINVLGGENITIGALNPTGSNVIYKFDYYLDWMSEGLSKKVTEWQNAVEENKSRYCDLNLSYYSYLEEKTDRELEEERLNTQLSLYKRCRDNIVAESSTALVSDYNKAITESGGTAVDITAEIGETLSAIDELMEKVQSEKRSNASLLTIINSELDSVRQSIMAIQSSLSPGSFFSADELEELSHYIFEGSYTDDYVAITDIMGQKEKFEQMRILYDRAQARLERVSAPKCEFKIDAENYIFAKEFVDYAEQLETGCLINVETEADNVSLLFLSNMTVNYEERTLHMTFGNSFNKFDPKSLFDNVLGSVAKSANTLNYIKEILYPIKQGELDSIKDTLGMSRNLSMGSVLTANNEEVFIDASGYTGRKRLSNGRFDPRQVKLVGRMLVFTDDNWETCKVAIGDLSMGDGESAYGINAESIVGEMIIGNNLRIVDKDGRDLLSVVDDKIQTSVYGSLGDATASISRKMTQLEQKSDSVSIKIQALERDINEGIEIDNIKTSTGYTFDKDGMTIHKSGEEMETLLDNTGVYVSRSGEEVFTANNEGVAAMNITTRDYLTVGVHSRFEDYAAPGGGNRTACFYIGE